MDTQENALDVMSVNANEQPFFRALLVPYRSLGRTGFLILMAALVLSWIVIGAMFFSIGAWPVTGFFGLDVAALYLAFHLNYRAARRREEVTLSRTELRIEKVPASGKPVQYSFNPFWTRFQVSKHPEIGVTDMTVIARSEEVSLGTFLNPADRENFARAFGLALSKAKGR